MNQSRDGRGAFRAVLLPTSPRIAAAGGEAFRLTPSAMLVLRAPHDDDGRRQRHQPVLPLAAEATAALLQR